MLNSKGSIRVKFNEINCCMCRKGLPIDFNEWFLLTYNKEYLLKIRSTFVALEHILQKKNLDKPYYHMKYKC
jgi:hypothetical protein